MVAISSLTFMVTMVTSFIIFEDMEGREEADVELMDGLSDDRPHPENKVGCYQVHKSQVRQSTSKGHFQPWIPEGRI